MKALLPALPFLVSFAALAAPGEEAVVGGTEAFWLTSESPAGYEDLVLTRRPLAELPAFAPEPGLRISEYDAIIVTTYDRDSIWNTDGRPFKPLLGVEGVDADTLVLQGERFTYTRADLDDVLRLLRDPEGKISIHRIWAPAAGQEEEIAELASRLEAELVVRAYMSAGLPEDAAEYSAGGPAGSVAAEPRLGARLPGSVEKRLRLLEMDSGRAVFAVEGPDSRQILRVLLEKRDGRWALESVRRSALPPS